MIASSYVLYFLGLALFLYGYTLTGWSFRIAALILGPATVIMFLYLAALGALTSSTVATAGPCLIGGAAVVGYARAEKLGKWQIILAMWALVVLDGLWWMAAWIESVGWFVACTAFAVGTVTMMLSFGAALIIPGTRDDIQARITRKIRESRPGANPG